MVDTIARPEMGLTELLAARARGAGRRRLGLDVALGLAVGSLVAGLRPPAWPVLLSAALCFAAFGCWGLADRRLQQAAARSLEPTLALVHDASAPDSAPWRAARSLAALVGTLAAVALVLSVLFTLMGRSFIS